MSFLYAICKYENFLTHGSYQQVKVASSTRKSIEAKRARSFDGCSSKERLEIQDKPRFKKRVYNQVPSKFPKAMDDKVSNPRPKK